MRNRTFGVLAVMIGLLMQASSTVRGDDVMTCYVTDADYNYGGTPGYSRAFASAHTCLFGCSPVDMYASWDDGTFQYAHRGPDQTVVAEFFHQCPTSGACSIHVDMYDTQGNYCQADATFNY